MHAKSALLPALCGKLTKGPFVLPLLQAPEVTVAAVVYISVAGVAVATTCNLTTQVVVGAPSMVLVVLAKDQKCYTGCAPLQVSEVVPAIATNATRAALVSLLSTGITGTPGDDELRGPRLATKPIQTCKASGVVLITLMPPFPKGPGKPRFSTTCLHAKSMP